MGETEQVRWSDCEGQGRWRPEYSCDFLSNIASSYTKTNGKIWRPYLVQGETRSSHFRVMQVAVAIPFGVHRRPHWAHSAIGRED